MRSRAAEAETFNGPVKNEQDIPYSFYEATTAEIDEAIHKAHTAAAIYKRISYTKRAEFLERIADEIMAVGPELISYNHAGKQFARSKVAWRKRDRTTGQLGFSRKY